MIKYLQVHSSTHNTHTYTCIHTHITHTHTHKTCTHTYTQTHTIHIQTHITHTQIHIPGVICDKYDFILYSVNQNTLLNCNVMFAGAHCIYIHMYTLWIQKCWTLEAIFVWSGTVAIYLCTKNPKFNNYKINRDHKKQTNKI